MVTESVGKGFANAQPSSDHERSGKASERHVLAYMWYQLAAAGLPVKGQVTREKAIENRDLVASRMTPDQIAEAERMAKEWKPAKGLPEK